MKQKIMAVAEKSAFYPTLKSFLFDKKKFSARLRTNRMLKKYLKSNKELPAKLHFGCGDRLVDGWLNVDIASSDIDVDFSKGKLPFPRGYFNSILSQHVIEHLEIERELLPILSEFHRILRDGGEVWLSCPSIEKICKSYVLDGGRSLLEGRKRRFPSFETKGFPSSFIVNDLFHQGGEHKNLFDFKLLQFLLAQSGFKEIEEVTEEQLLEQFNEFPSRNDAEQTLYVRAAK